MQRILRLTLGDEVFRSQHCSWDDIPLGYNWEPDSPDLSQDSESKLFKASLSKKAISQAFIVSSYCSETSLLLYPSNEIGMRDQYGVHFKRSQEAQEMGLWDTRAIVLSKG